MVNDNLQHSGIVCSLWWGLLVAKSSGRIAWVVDAAQGLNKTQLSAFRVVGSWISFFAFGTDCPLQKKRCNDTDENVKVQAPIDMLILADFPDFSDFLGRLHPRQT